MVVMYLEPHQIAYVHLLTILTHIATELWLLYIGKILVTVNALDTVKMRACIVTTITVKTKSIRPRNKSHSCFTCHCLIP